MLNLSIFIEWLCAAAVHGYFRPIRPAIALLHFLVVAIIMVDISAPFVIMPRNAADKTCQRHVARLPPRITRVE